jgi:hypothetical protein
VDFRHVASGVPTVFVCVCVGGGGGTRWYVRKRSY